MEVRGGSPARSMVQSSFKSLEVSKNILIFLNATSWGQMTTISEETYSRGCEGRWYATASCSSCSTGVCCWSSLAAVSQQLPCRPYQFSVILQPFFLSHPHSLSLARRPQVPRQQYRHGVYRHFISTTPPLTNWHQSWYTRVKLGGIPPPDLRSGTSCLRSTTSNNRYCTSQPRSGTFC